MHANGRGWHTAEALPQIISTLEAQGYTFVTISDLLNLETPQTPLQITE
jgi:peptidoglycan/xylan/chitin deacetylase (PgdA/CDA1 family)